MSNRIPQPPAEQIATPPAGSKINGHAGSLTDGPLTEVAVAVPATQPPRGLSIRRNRPTATRDEANHESGPEPANRIVELLLADGAVPYCNPLGELRIRRPTAPGTRRVRFDFCIDSRCVAGWMSRLLYESRLPPLSAHEQRQALFILDGFALDNEEPVDVTIALESDPILMTLCAVVGQRGWSATASEMLRILPGAAERLHICSQYDTRWPRSAARLSLYIQSVQHWFPLLKMEYEYVRYEHSRIHVFGPLPAGEKPPPRPEILSKSKRRGAGPDRCVAGVSVAPQSVADPAVADANLPSADPSSACLSSGVNDFCDRASESADDTDDTLGKKSHFTPPA